MTESEIQAQIDKKNAELETLKTQIAASLTTWPAFLKLPWPEQEHIRELVPGRVAQLESDHFRKIVR